jgi:hypothetical protein
VISILLFSGCIRNRVRVPLWGVPSIVLPGWSGPPIRDEIASRTLLWTQPVACGVRNVGAPKPRQQTVTVGCTGSCSAQALNAVSHPVPGGTLLRRLPAAESQDGSSGLE